MRFVTSAQQDPLLEDPHQLEKLHFLLSHIDEVEEFVKAQKSKVVLGEFFDSGVKHQPNLTIVRCRTQPHVLNFSFDAMKMYFPTLDVQSPSCRRPAYSQ